MKTDFIDCKKIGQIILPETSTSLISNCEWIEKYSASVYGRLLRANLPGWSARQHKGSGQSASDPGL